MSRKHGNGGWNPYLAGALTGLLAVLSAFATTRLAGKTHYLGASTTFVRAAGMLEQAAAPAVVCENAYFKKTGIRFDWQFLFVGGILVGALAASLTDRSFTWERVPPLWEEHFGHSAGRRALAALLGGSVAMIGARLADGCPSGHGLSGLMMLSASGFVALALFFGAGVLVARLVYRGGQSHD